MASIKIEASTELPLFLQDGGDERVEERRKELETYVKVLNKNPLEILEKTFKILNPWTLDPKEVGEEEAKKIDTWFGETTNHEFYKWIFNNNHKVNGKFNNWSSGFMGSRWADTEINGRRCRIAFYSRKHNPQSFPPDMKMQLGKRYDYILEVDPTL